MKNICVFCASSEQIPGIYHQAARDFGLELARRGCGLVFGGGSVGLMGTLAKAVRAGGGRVYGVIPSYLREGEDRFSQCDELVLTETLAERKQHMIENSQGFAVLPGGYGTLDEAFEVLTMRRHGRLPEPVVFLNTGGFFDSLLAFLERLMAEGFLQTPFSKDVRVTADPAEAAAFLGESVE